MLSKLSKRVTHFYFSKEKIEDSEIEIYEYCFEILFASIINFLVVIIIGFACQKYIETILFIVCFLTLRQLAGGYHADTHFRCVIILLFVLVLFLVMIYFVPIKAIDIINHFALLLVLPIIAIVAPIDHPNNQLNIKKLSKGKLLSILFVVTFLVTSTILGYYNYTIISFSIVYPISAVCISCIAGLIKNIINLNKGGHHGEEENN